MLRRVWKLVILTAVLPGLFAETLKKIAGIDLPGPPGKRFDYLTIDYEDHYLPSTHLAAGLLYVIDTSTNRLIKAIPGVPGVEGVEYGPALKKVYTSDSGDNQIGVVDLRSMRVIERLPAAAKPDGSACAEPFVARYPVGRCRGSYGMALDPDHRLAFLACEGSELTTVFDLDARKRGTHHVYPAEQEEDGRPVAGMIVYEAA